MFSGWAQLVKKESEKTTKPTKQSQLKNCQQRYVNLPS